MVERHDYVALEWVRGEIQETLNQARQALETYVEAPEDATQMRFCLAYLHQVTGTLQMVEFFGAALLSEEMEKLAAGLVSGEVTSSEDVLSVLMQAILQLPNYLDKVKQSQKDVPVVLLPLLNELRSARGDALMSETALFSPNMAAARPDLGEINTNLFSNPSFLELMRKLRQMYQYALIGVFRNADIENNLGYLVKVLQRLDKLTSSTPKGQLWFVAHGFILGLQDQTIELGAAAKRLLKQLDNSLKDLIDRKAESLSEFAEEEILKNLLYYIAKSDSELPEIIAVKDRYELGSSLPTADQDGSQMSGPDASTMESVVSALMEELARIKDNLDIMVRGKIQDVNSLSSLLPDLKHVGDTMAVLGLGIPRQVLLDQMGTINELISSGQTVTDSALMDIAGALLYVEATLSGLADEHGAVRDIDGDIGTAHEAVVREARNGLETAKEAITDYIGSQFKPDVLKEIPAILQSIRGGLQMIPLAQAAAIVSSSGNYIQEKLIDSGQRPAWEELDTLADALMGVEYFLERISQDGNGTNVQLLGKAADSVAQLGYEIPDNLEDSVSSTTSEVEDHLAEAPVVEALDIRDKDDDISQPEEEPFAEIPPQEDEPESASTEALPKSFVSSDESVDLPELQLTEAEDVATPEVEPQVTAAEIDSSQDTVVEEEEDDLIDDDIIEIFLEEAEEVLENINEFFPQYKADEGNEDALTEFRRAYHTLKGSGRMVGATVIGELAWSVENMLNRLIDGTVSRSQPLLEVVEEVTALVPSLVEAFRNRVKPDTTEVDRLSEKAFAISKNEWSEDGVQAAPAAEQAPEPQVEETVPIEENKLLEVFRAELDTHMNVVETFVNAAEEAGGDHPLQDKVQRALHTVKGSAHMAGFNHIADLAAPIETMIKELQEWHIPADEKIRSVLTELLGRIRITLACIEAGEPEPEDNVEFLESVSNLHHDLIKERRASNEESDPNLMAIFMSESMDLMLDAEQMVHRWQTEDLSHDELLKLHTELLTLAGAAKAVDLNPVVSLSESLGSLYKCVLDLDIHPEESFFDVAKDGQEQLIGMMDRLAAGQSIHRQKDLEYRVSELIGRLQVQEPAQEEPIPVAPAEELEAEDFLSENSVLEIDLADFAEPEVDLEISEELLSSDVPADLPEAVEVEFEEEPTAIEVSEEAPSVEFNELDVEANTDSENPEFNLEVPTEFDAAPPAQAGEVLFVDGDQELVDIFLEEALDILESIQTHFQNWQYNPNSLDNVLALQRELHTLKGGARMAEISAIGDLAHELEFLYEDLCDQKYAVSPGLFTLCGQCHDRLADMVHEVQSAQQCTSAPDLVESIANWRQNPGVTSVTEQISEAPVFEPEPIEPIVVDGEDDEDSDAIEILEPESLELESLDEDLTSDLLELDTEQPVFIESPVTEEEPEILDQESSEFTVQDNVGAEEANEIEISRFDESDSLDLSGLVDSENLSEPVSSEFEPETESEEPEPELGVEKVEKDEEEIASPALAFTDEDIDYDILEIFVDEANELLHELDEAISAWQESPADQAHSDEMKRVLHTLKGGARLAKLKTLGDMSHEFETFVINAERSHADLDSRFFNQVLARYDEMATGVETMQALLDQQGVSGAVGPSVIAQVEDEPELPEENEEAQQAESVEPDTSNVTNLADVRANQEPQPSNVVPFQKKVEEKEPKAPAPKKKAEATKQTRNQPQETVKVNSSLLENLVNLAGETSISRSRLEQQVSDFGFTLDEMESTIERMRDQVRRLDIETEAQMAYRQEIAEESDYADFDPLEMDRYSSIQQLSRSLMEAASDLLDLKSSMVDKTRDAETMLLQQSRINTELQEGLMQTRMVPFNRIVPRLRRIVRQVSSELGKSVEFHVHNGDSELDRTVLERMISPLEHMLRNAVDHGIEIPADRTSKGKNEVGAIELSLSREGGDAVIRIKDDGAGIDVDKVRAKAIEKGVIQASEQIEDKEVLRFILDSGFSTAERVTQISGRGVGMDVVHSEVKQLGGTMAIDTTVGQGSEFVITLPVSVSVNRALMVTLGEDLYAIPLDTIEGIVRVTPSQLQEYYRPDAPAFEYAGAKYNVSYLGQVLQSDHQTYVMDQNQPVPLILVKGAGSSGKSLALHVDSLMGSREIVVKPLGPQFADVSLISGATILGDGSVVVIIDLSASLRQGIALEASVQHLPAAANDEETEIPEPALVEERPPLIMVTDDSVTVRKVTTRLLQRNGMDVITAKDGADAITQLQDHTPDLMLLDIEMPRMDGFEVASRIRHDSRLKGLPIIMITSRTGQKHRDRALSIGVNEYMGKPFQEGPLLETINRLLGID